MRRRSWLLVEQIARPAAGFVILVNLLRSPHHKELLAAGKRALGIGDAGMEKGDRRAFELVATADRVPRGVRVVNYVGGVERIVESPFAEHNRFAAVPHSLGLAFESVLAADGLRRDGDDGAGAEEERGEQRRDVCERHAIILPRPGNHTSQSSPTKNVARSSRLWGQWASRPLLGSRARCLTAPQA